VKRIIPKVIFSGLFAMLMTAFSALGFSALGFSALGFSASGPTITTWLVPKLHFIFGYEQGEPVQMYFQRTPVFDAQKLEIKSISVTGLKVRSWQLFEAFGKPLLEIDFEPKPGDDINFETIQIKDARGREFTVSVGPNRVMYLKPKAKYELNFELLEQIPNNRLYLAMQFFNDSPQTVTINRIVYAPKIASTNRILLNPAYDSTWFTKLELWSRALVTGSGVLPPLPDKANYADANNLNLNISPSRGFSAAIVEPSLKAKYSCLRLPAAKRPDPKVRRDNAYLQGVIEYRVGSGPKQLYPIPDSIQTDVCL
jgi:hypothetical protein